MTEKKKKHKCCGKLKPVNQLEVKKGMKADDLVKAMAESGVMGAGRIGQAADIMERMFKDKDCTVYLGLAGAMVPGGMKRVIIDLLKSGKIDVLVTTGANLTHDLVEALGYHHYQGSPQVDDNELNKKSIDRIYDSYMPNHVYEGMEDFFEKHFDSLASKKMNIKEFLWELGKLVPTKDSVLRTCADMKIPIFCPAIADSGIGLMIWGHLARGKKMDVSAFDDLKEILQTGWDCKKAGVPYLGGGVPKNYIQQAMQFSPKGSEYGIQITMDRPEPGGSSGAELREGISWGKMSHKGNFVDVICDVTIALPLIYSAVKNRM